MYLLVEITIPHLFITINKGEQYLKSEHPDNMPSGNLFLHYLPSLKVYLSTEHI